MSGAGGKRRISESTAVAASAAAAAEAVLLLQARTPGTAPSQCLPCQVPVSVECLGRCVAVRSLSQSMDTGIYLCVAASVNYYLGTVCKRSRGDHRFPAESVIAFIRVSSEQEQFWHTL